MSETTVKCAECGKRVPKQRFCGDCGSPLVVVRQPTPSRQGTSGQVSTPVQVSDSILSDSGGNRNPGEQTTDAVNEPQTLPAPCGATLNTDKRNEETSDKFTSKPPSYADVTRSNPSGEGKESSQEDNWGSLSNSEIASSASISENNVTIFYNKDFTAPNIDSEGTNRKVKVDIN